MRVRMLRRQALLSTTMIVGALTGYGGRAYGQQVCTDQGGQVFLCDNASTDTQDLTNQNNATVNTGANFSVDTTGGGSGGNAVTITGDGALSYTDANASPLTAAAIALSVTATGDDGGTPGSVTINTNGALVGGTYGILADNYGSGAVSITADGDVTGTAARGIDANNSGYGTDLTINTGTDSAVMGDTQGVYAINYGSGALSITANGEVTGTTEHGIYASARGTNGTGFTVTSGSSSTVSGGSDGIYARNRTYGVLEVTANGDVDGDTGAGIRAVSDGNSVQAPGSGVTVTTAVGTTVSGYLYGIFATNADSGDLTVTANGNVNGSEAIVATSGSSYGNLIVTTGANSIVAGSTNGVRADNLGYGALTITANGNVSATVGYGITAQNDAFAADLTVITGAGSSVMGNSDGIFADNDGYGALSIIAGGTVTATVDDGIAANNSLNGTDLTVTTGAGSTITGDSEGMSLRNYGSGALEVTANGDVTGTNFFGIFARNNTNGTNLAVTTGTGSTVTGGSYAIEATNLGSGETTITVNGNVTSDTASGVRAIQNYNGTDLTVTTGAGSTVTGSNRGISTSNNGSGTLEVTANGNVTGNTGAGIFAGNGGGGDVTIAVAAASTVSSNGAGVSSFAIDTNGGPASVTVAGTLNGGDAGAIRFDQVNTLDDRLALQTGSAVNGNVLGGGGTDTLALQGTGQGAFNVSQLVDFETGEVDSGTWNLSGATSADFTVNGGTLKGTGTFGSLAANGGIIAPGNSIGTMTVNGAFTLAAGSVFEVEVNAQGQSDKVIVTGTVNLTGATLRVLAANGNYKPKTEYTIIDNDGIDPVNGTFGTITSNFAFLTPTVQYNGGTGNDVVLMLIRNDVPFDDFADTPNEEAVAKGLGKCSLTNPLCVAVYNLASGQVSGALDALSGEIHATVAGTLADDSRYVREAVLGRLVQATYTNNAGEFAVLAAGGPQVALLDSQAMALGYAGKSLSAPAAESLAFWTRAYGAWGDFDGDGNAATADRDLGGFISGMDANIGGGWRAGLATGVSFSNVSVAARYSSADVETYHLGGYAGGMVSSFALRAGGMWAWSDIDTSRAVVFPGFYERQKASYDADTGQLFGEVAYPTQMMGMALEPFGGLAYVSIDSDTIHERGGAASLRGSVEDQNVGYSTVGLRAATTMRSFGMAVTPNFSVAWLHAFDDVTPGAALAFASTGIGFNVAGVPLAKDTALIDAGLDFALADDMTAGVSYTGQFGGGVSDNGVKGRFTWLF